MYRNSYYLNCSEQIGNDIDMVIIDTVHSLPGELLDFLACFPSLKPGTVVIIHDILLNHLGNEDKAFATKLLLDVVVGEKIVGSDSNNIEDYPNIGAFVITEDTYKYISNVFSALTITWKYMPEEELLDLCKEHFSKHYSSDNCNMFKKAIEINKNTLLKQKEKNKNVISTIVKLIEGVHNKNIYIYGYGRYGKLVYDIMDTWEGINFKSFVVSDDQKIDDESLGLVKHLREVIGEIKDEESVVILAVSHYLVKEIKSHLLECGITNIFYVKDILDFFNN